LASFALFLPTSAARAQTSVYGTVALTDFCSTVLSATTCKGDTVGLLVGGFYNFPIQSRVTVGVDGRLSQAFGRKGGTSVTGAVRVAFVPKVNPLRPYFELGGGVVSSAGTAPPVYAPRYTSGVLQLAMGLDIKLTDSFDLRAIEFGGASGGGAGTKPAAGTGYLDAGIVYHFGHR